jgi:LmbE family N-acetylglucosaminyl deacetylase
MSLSAWKRGLANDYLFPAVEQAWAMLFRLTRPLWSRQVNAWQPGSGWALIVAPHPDDETLATGGVAALHRRHGDGVTIVVVTDGRASAAGGLSPVEMAQRRRAEVEAAASCLGVNDLICLDLPEREWTAEAARPLLSPLLASHQVVYAPSCVDFHPDHLRLAALLGEMVRPRQRVRVYELGVPLTPVLANQVADVSGVRELKERALACFASQQGAFGPLRRLAHYRAAGYRRAAVELFWDLPGDAYRRLIAFSDWGWQTTPFRGVYPRPFSDPLAFLQGWRMRRRLLAAAQVGCD